MLSHKVMVYIVPFLMLILIIIGFFASFKGKDPYDREY